MFEVTLFSNLESVSTRVVTVTAVDMVTSMPGIATTGSRRAVPRSPAYEGGLSLHGVSVEISHFFYEEVQVFTSI